MLNPIFWKKVQGQKHPGRWGIVEHQIPSIKVLLRTNVKSHKHPSIKLLSVNQRKQNLYRRAYIYIYMNTELLDGNKGHQEETHQATDMFRDLFLDQTPTLLFESKNHVSINKEPFLQVDSYLPCPGQCSCKVAAQSHLQTRHSQIQKSLCQYWTRVAGSGLWVWTLSHFTDDLYRTFGPQTLGDDPREKRSTYGAAMVSHPFSKYETNTVSRLSPFIVSVCRLM